MPPLMALHLLTATRHLAGAMAFPRVPHLGQRPCPNEAASMGGEYTIFFWLSRTVTKRICIPWPDPYNRTRAVITGQFGSVGWAEAHPGVGTRAVEESCIMAARFVTIMTAGLILGLVVPSWGEPRIVISAPEYNVGKVYYGDKASAAFELVNTGDALLIIDRVRVSCGCTKATADPKEVPPGSKGLVSVSYDSHGQPTGAQTKIISVYSNDSRKPVVELRLSLDVVRELEVIPSSLARKIKSFQKEIALPVKIKNNSDREVTITGAKAFGADAHVEVSPPNLRIGPKSTGEVELVLTLKNPREFRMHMGRIVIQTDHPREHDVRLTYLVEIETAEVPMKERLVLDRP